MKQKIAIGILVGITLGAFLSLIGTPVRLFDVLMQPLRTAWGSPQTLSTGLLDDETTDRFLLKPLGAVRVDRRFPAPAEPPSDASPAH